MNMLKLVLVLSIVALGILVWGIEDTSAHRAYDVKTWNLAGDGTIFLNATGTFNSTLSVTIPNTDSDGGARRCDLFVGEVLRDPKTSRELLEKGFTSLQCGGLTVSIK